jgi:hypothetical protein
MEPIAVTITEFDGPFTSTYEGVDKEQYKIVMTPTDPALAETRIFAFATRSWHEKAGNGTTGLRNIVNALHARDLTHEQILEFDPDAEGAFVGKSLVVIGKLNDKGYLKPIGYKRVGAQKAATAAATAAVKEALAEEALSI